MTKIIETPTEWKTERKSFGEATVGFVPTMGNLHAGHESLLKRSQQENDYTVLSIFVNPSQFNNPKDFQNYPITLKEDIKLAEKLSIDYLFIPQQSDLYPDHYRYRVTEKDLSETLCGKHRPGHFEGVLTVVLKLLLLIKPTRAYFGEKDFQQLELVKGMVNAFFIDVEIIPCEIIRDSKGLALSSRNSRLTPEQYQLALEFPKLLASKLSPSEVFDELNRLGFVVDYVEDQKGRRLAAVTLGEVRLIDNMPCL